uniref:SERPIN domain-containing protein n=1 Tax=Parastrongyloides trichosuri TaxID=131310 RepID=A0A0N4ZHB4_PARTI
MSTYTSSANSARMDKYFISLPVSIYLGEGYTMSDATEESSRGFVVYKYSEENYANFLLASLMRKKTLVLTEEEYEKIKSYTISKEDAYSFLKINFKS